MSIHNTSQSGRAETFGARLSIRDLNGDVRARLRAWIHDRLGRQLGKYTAQIERIEVRIEDVNGPKGGDDRCCMVHVVLSGLPPVVVEMRGASEREAFDLAAGAAERATRRNLERHGLSTGHKRRYRGGKEEATNAALDGLSMPPQVERREEAPLQDQQPNVGAAALPDRSRPD